MARKLQLLPNLFLNMDNIVSWQLEDDAIIIDTVAKTIRVGIGYADDIQVTSNDLQRVINSIGTYFD
ncbi:hypothetical protein [Aliivibrio fischeri]|uniref:hypothetical protein n=1 Tax=Aliivibrio fischeri TaxID=668 RepID=UPI0007C48E21|nr:hypothetical protein [Aliivibrio fischeri]